VNSQIYLSTIAARGPAEIWEVDKGQSGHYSDEKAVNNEIYECYYVGFVCKAVITLTSSYQGGHFLFNAAESEFKRLLA